MLNVLGVLYFCLTHSLSLSLSLSITAFSLPFSVRLMLRQAINSLGQAWQALTLFYSLERLAPCPLASPLPAFLLLSSRMSLRIVCIW